VAEGVGVVVPGGKLDLGDVEVVERAGEVDQGGGVAGGDARETSDGGLAEFGAVGLPGAGDRDQDERDIE
jgi:hypothetical protein